MDELTAKIYERKDYVCECGYVMLTLHATKILKCMNTDCKLFMIALELPTLVVKIVREKKDG